MPKSLITPFVLALQLLLIPLSGAAETVDIAIVGGTTFGHPPEFGAGLTRTEKRFTVRTRVGTSPPIYLMRYKGKPFYYVQMHGEEEKPGDEDPGFHFIRTWAALHELGVRFALGGATAGGIDPVYRIGDLIVPHDFIIFSSQREQSVLKAAGIKRPGIFPNFQQPFTEELRQLIIEEALRQYPGTVHPRGVIFQDDPMRFETPAEIRMMRVMGGDHVTHNVASEAVYARQLGIHFAALNSVSNPAVGVRPFTFEDMQAGVQEIAAHSIRIILDVMLRIDEIRDRIDPESIGDRFEGEYTKPPE